MENFRRTSGPAAPSPAPEDLSTVALVKEIGGEFNRLLSLQFELAKTELKGDLKREIGVLAGLGIAGLGLVATVNLLLVTAILALARWMAGWQAGLILSAVALLFTVLVGLVSWRRRVRDPLARTRRTVKRDLRWPNEKGA